MKKYVIYITLDDSEYSISEASVEDVLRDTLDVIDCTVEEIE